MAARKAVETWNAVEPWWTNFVLKSWNLPRNILELEEPRGL